MGMIRSILVAYDGSHGARIALQHAVDVASRCDARIALLTGSRSTDTDAELLPDERVDPTVLAQDLPEPDEEQARPTEVDEVLGEAVDLCRELTVRCVACPAHGDVTLALVQRSRLADLVFIGRDALAGSATYVASARTARRVAAGAACPVVVTPRQYETIRSALAVCPPGDAGARALKCATELAAILQVKLEVLAVAEVPHAARRWANEAKRYLVDHGHSSSVLVRKPPLAQQLAALLGDRLSPLIVVPRGRWLAAMLRRDPLSDALKTLGATVCVQP
jgi:nucleotide-binding universal stress UspA family protein